MTAVNRSDRPSAARTPSVSGFDTTGLAPCTTRASTGGSSRVVRLATRLVMARCRGLGLGASAARGLEVEPVAVARRVHEAASPSGVVAGERRQARDDPRRLTAAGVALHALPELDGERTASGEGPGQARHDRRVDPADLRSPLRCPLAGSGVELAVARRPLGDERGVDDAGVDHGPGQPEGERPIGTDSGLDVDVGPRCGPGPHRVDDDQWGARRPLCPLDEGPQVAVGDQGVRPPDHDGPRLRRRPRDPCPLRCRWCTTSRRGR